MNDSTSVLQKNKYSPKTCVELEILYNIVSSHLRFNSNRIHIESQLLFCILPEKMLQGDKNWIHFLGKEVNLRF